MSLENRSCNCENMQNEVSNVNDNNCNDVRDEMLGKIKCYSFAITELAQYLDTHPSDEKALCLHNKYCKELRALEDKYQKLYGPLTIKCPCNKWRWIELPWPWEGGND